MPRRFPALLRRAHSCTPGNNGLPAQKTHSGNRYRYEALRRSSRCSVDSSTHWAQPRHQVQATSVLVRVFGSHALRTLACSTCAPMFPLLRKFSGASMSAADTFCCSGSRAPPSTGAGPWKPLLLPGFSKLLPGA